MARVGTHWVAVCGSLLLLCGARPSTAWAQGVPSDAPAATQAKSISDAALDGVPETFTPLVPVSDAQRGEIELIKLYAAARALEDQERSREALALLEQARANHPQNAAILRRLSRLFFSAGKIDEALETGRQAMAIDPSDTQILTLLFGLMLERKSNPTAAESFLRSILDNPGLDRSGASALICQRALGDLYAELLNKPEKAADCYEAVVTGLEARQAARFSQSDRSRILHGGSAESYLKFGTVLVGQSRLDTAIRALRDGLAYDPTSGELTRVLAEALLKSGKASEALQTLEPFLAKQPQGREPYELLEQIFEAMGRKGDFLAHLETSAKNDSENLSLQFFLADKLREAGRVEESEARLKELLEKQHDPLVYGPLTSSLLNAGKTAEFLRILDEALTQRGAIQALTTQIERVAGDPRLSAELLDAASKRLAAEPHSLREPTRRVLTYVAVKSNHPDELVKLGRLFLDQSPTVQNYTEYIQDLLQARRHTEAAAAIDELIAKYPDQNTPRLLAAKSQSLFFSGQIDKALEAARQGLKADPNNQQSLFFVGFLLGRAGKNDEAIEHYQKILARFPNDPEIERQARSGLSVIYVNQDDLQKGEHELELILEKSPDDPGTNNDLGYLYADQGKNLDQAEEMIRKAVAEEPENPSYLDSLGWVLFKKGKLNEAVEQLKKAARDNTVDATILDHLGDVQFQLKQYQAAKSAWVRSQEIAERSNPPDKRLAQVKRKLAELGELMASPGSTKPPSP